MKHRKIVRLVQVRNERKAAEARAMRADMHDSVRSITGNMGDHLSGYALIVWDRDGDFQTIAHIGAGPFGRGALPEQCRDAINRHLAASAVSPASTGRNNE